MGKSAIDRIVKKIQNNISSPTDDHGKHPNRPNKLSADINMQIYAHINSLPKRQSHYSKLDKSNTRYLSPNFSVAKLSTLKHIIYSCVKNVKMFIQKGDYT